MDVRVAQLYVVDYAFIVLAFGLGGVVPPQHSSHRRQRAIAGIVASTCYLYLARTGSPQCSVQRLGKGEKGRLVFECPERGPHAGTGFLNGPLMSTSTGWRRGPPT